MRYWPVVWTSESSLTKVQPQQCERGKAANSALSYATTSTTNWDWSTLILTGLASLSLLPVVAFAESIPAATAKSAACPLQDVEGVAKCRNSVSQEPEYLVSEAVYPAGWFGWRRGSNSPQIVQDALMPSLRTSRPFHLLPLPSRVFITVAPSVVNISRNIAAKDASAPSQATSNIEHTTTPHHATPQGTPHNKNVPWDADDVALGVGGSGFLWDHTGHIVTSYHILGNMRVVGVTLSDGTTWQAVLVGADPDADVAVLKIVNMGAAALKALQPVVLGNSQDLVVGQQVFAIGNPFGLNHTMTQGIVSGLGRAVLYPGSSSGAVYAMRNLIQTDAAINPGNSGGVLVDERGAVVGMTSALVDPFGGGNTWGLGFAVPISAVKPVVEALIKGEVAVRPMLGITPLPPQLMRCLGQPGVIVMDIAEGGPAAEAGLQPCRSVDGTVVLGDIITHVDGRQVSGYGDLVALLETHRPGDKMPIKIQRAAEVLTLEVTLGGRPMPLVQQDKTSATVKK